MVKRYENVKNLEVDKFFREKISYVATLIELCSDMLSFVVARSMLQIGYCRDMLSFVATRSMLKWMLESFWSSFISVRL